MFNLGKQLAVCHSVASQLVGHDHSRYISKTLQQSPKETFGGPSIPPWLNEDVEHDTVLIHGTPQIMLYALDANEHLVHIPLIPRLWPAAAQAVGETLTEFLAPAPHCLVGHDHTTFGQNQLNVPETQAEHVVQPDGMADDLGREAVAVMRVGCGFMLSVSPASASQASPG